LPDRARAVGLFCLQEGGTDARRRSLFRGDEPMLSKTGGRAPRQKGNRFEAHLRDLLQNAGLAAERVPLSGSAGGKFAGDLSVPLLGIDRVVEVKCRADGFRELYSWLIDRDALIVRADRRVPLVILPLPLAIAIAKIAESKR
jgi:hypothetical protein